MEQQNKAPIPYWRSLLLIGGGIVVGLLVVLSLRVLYYASQGYEPNMAPETAFVFFPLFAIVLLLSAVVLEPLLRRFAWPPRTFAGATLVGISYAAALSWWAFPHYSYVVILLNPISLRLVGLTSGSNRSRAKRAPV